jgi:hypothetical protein
MNKIRQFFNSRIETLFFLCASASTAGNSFSRCRRRGAKKTAKRYLVYAAFPEYLCKAFADAAANPNLK